MLVDKADNSLFFSDDDLQATYGNLNYSTKYQLPQA